MNSIFSDRITDVPKSFIREILKIAVDPSVISFAGGLPNRELFPVEEIKQAAIRVLEEYGREALQYSKTEGHQELREYLSQRYKDKHRLDLGVENILITNGSQQGLDLVGKILLNRTDDVVIEEPGYLGAIQAFSVYRATFNPVPVSEEGMDIGRLQTIMSAKSPKLIYAVPNFQNPSGISYSEANRQAVAELVRDSNTLLIEDDPYGDLRFEGVEKTSFKKLIPDNTVLLGSFSKTIVPSFRLGWIAAPDRIMEKLIIAKQAADLHTNNFAQCVIHRYITDNDFDRHISKIISVYGSQRNAMIESIRQYFPPGIGHTSPEGGMFLWVTLPEHVSSMKLFEKAIIDKVAFVPGHPFYIDRREVNTLRLNYSCVDEETINIGINRLGQAIREQLAE
ncbi:MAG: PLP-dependent aminotransferase family protein [Deltaproteobacteria bacterium]|nr:MAG: PLP-dependent aminotransferase family protein [Deltaproteobacteria bacterium]